MQSKRDIAYKNYEIETYKAFSIYEEKRLDNTLSLEEKDKAYKEYVLKEDEEYKNLNNKIF